MHSLKHSLAHRYFSAREGGFVLATALIMLFVLTMLMVSTMRANVMEERMASNSRDWNVAFQAAEAALRDGGQDIMTVQRISGTTGFLAGCNSGGNNQGLCLPSTDGTPIWIELTTNGDAGWVSGSDSNTKTIKYGAYTNAGSFASDVVAAQPRYIVEVLSVPQSGSLKTGNGTPSFNYFYRVTAVGFGASLTTRVMLQAVYRQY